MDGFMRALVSVWTDSGFAALTIENVIMILVGLVLLYLAIAKEYEPLLLMPIAFGDIMANFPNTGFETDMGVMMAIGFGIKYEIFQPLIFMGVGAMTSMEDINAFIEKVGFPVLVRPSYVLSGAAMNVCSNQEELERFLQLVCTVTLRSQYRNKCSSSDYG